MDFLDSLELSTTTRKAHRVRSWYLYEQFKSLEKNQLEATQKLKDRSYQDRILRQELSERRARRSLYDLSGLHQIDSSLEKSIRNSNKEELNVNADDFFESVCELQENEELAHGNVLSEDTFSQDDSLEEKSYTEEFKTVDDTKDDCYAESVDSVMENINQDKILSDDLKNVLKRETNIAQNIHWQLKDVKENIQCIEKCTELADDTTSETSSTKFTEELNIKHVAAGNKSVKEQNNLLMMWTRLVSFAYQVMQLNHGNCYYDFSSQFLTAVLACDVLRKGISKMCHILQPFVSPIKFADESDVSVVSSIGYINRKKSVQIKKSRKSYEKKVQARCEFKHARRKSPRIYRKYRSEECWARRSNDSINSHSNRKYRRASEPWRSISKLQKPEASKSSSCSIWPEFSKEDVRNSHLKICDCCWRKELKHSMSRLAQYINTMLKELEEFSQSENYTVRNVPS